MRKIILGLLVTGCVVGWAAYSHVAAETAKAPACKSIKVEFDCRARNDCEWVNAVLTSTGKEKRKAYCRRKPVSKKK